MDKKRLALIGGFVLATAILGYLLYRVFFTAPTSKKPLPGKGQSSTATTGFPDSGVGSQIRPGISSTSSLPGIETVPRGNELIPEAIKVEPVRQLLTDTISNPTVTKNGQIEFYNVGNGQFYRVNSDGQVELLTDQVFYNVSKVTWSPDQTESIIEYPDGANIYYNFATKKQVTLPAHWQDFAFAPAGQQIAAKSVGFSPENRWLVTADPDGKNVTPVEALGDNQDRVMVDWSPHQDVVALSLTGEPLGADRQEVLFVGLHGENFKSTIVEGRGLQTQWSPTGERLLYSVYNARNNFKPELWIVNGNGDAIGSGRELLGVSTWADKCTFRDERYVYCGVPRELPTGAGFAPKVADSIADRMVRIDVQTGIQTEILLNEAPTVDSLFLSPDGQTLFFTDKNRDGLFRVDVP